MSDRTAGYIFIALGVLVIISGVAICITNSVVFSGPYVMTAVFGGTFIYVGWRFLYSKSKY